MARFDQQNSGILEDLQLSEVGSDWNASPEKQRATLLALQSSPPSASIPFIVQNSQQELEHKGRRVSFESAQDHVDRQAQSGESYQSTKDLPVPEYEAYQKESMNAKEFVDSKFSLPLHIQYEIGTRTSPREKDWQHSFENSSGKVKAGMKSARRSRFYSDSLLPISAKRYFQARDQGPRADNLNTVSLDSEEYEAFRTRSEMINKTFARLQSPPQRKVDPETPIYLGHSPAVSTKLESLPARRYFAALEGPELDTLKDSEHIILPVDKKWPFLLRFPISSFGISLGLGSQTILWKNLAVTTSMHTLHISKVINVVLWCLTLSALIVLFSVYVLKFIFYFEAVHREFHHPVRVNFFFAPWIAGMFLLIGVPTGIATKIHPALWCVFMLPIFLLELKIYGQWLSGGERRLSKVANPSTHLSVVGNFVGAILGALVGWKEAALFFWAVGLAHYLVVFVTLYQRLPTNETLPKELHPVFFLFVAAPSAASVAWEKMTGDFDYVSRLVYFISLFLFSSLIVRLNFFRGFRFSIAWWAYTFPMTAASIATVRYSEKVRSHVTLVMAVALTVISSMTVLLLFFSTIFHLWSGSLFPNDMAIAITPHKKMVEKEGLEKESGWNYLQSRMHETTILS